MLLPRQPRPFRIVLRWQLIATVVLTLVAMALWGPEGAISAALGGGINVLAGWVYGWRVAQGAPQTVIRAPAVAEIYMGIEADA